MTTTIDHIELTGESDLSERELHAVLSSERRQAALSALTATATPTDLSELAEAVARRETDDRADADRVQDVAVTLHHVHLPKLDDHDVVSYDPAERTVGAVTDEIAILTDA